jgi:hypothetical protein
LLDGLVISEVVTIHDIRPVEGNTRIALHDENAVVLPIPVGGSFMPRSISVEMTERPDGKREMLLDAPLQHGLQHMDSSERLNANHRVHELENRRRRTPLLAGVILRLSVSLDVVQANVLPAPRYGWAKWSGKPLCP